MRFIIFANGNINDYSFVRKHLKSTDTIICCDGGVKHTKELEINPSFIIGDFDSADKDIFNYYRKKDIPFIPFPKEKDFTDLELCLSFALNRNAREILILGGTGGRIDHTIGNIHNLVLPLERNVKASLIDEENTIKLCNKEIIVSGTKEDIISLIPLTTEVIGIRTDGFYYPLSNETLKIGKSRGISNKLLGSTGKVTVESGILIVIQYTPSLLLE